ncbi:hypothetical protein ECDEC6C_4941 [Escherichia coli DEC6C]|nr:hypothetical protein ECDEC6C_4941 [Escherichia coli DEC6C]
MLVLAAIGVKPGNIPFDVISIIMAVIAAISAMCTDPKKLDS